MDRSQIRALVATGSLVLLTIGSIRSAVGNAPAPGAAPAPAAPAYIWLEAEKADSQTFDAAKARWGKVDSEGFSGGSAMLATTSVPGDGGTATWKFDAAAAGDYEVWARIGWRHWSDHQWRVDGGQWNTLTATGGNFEFIKVPSGNGVREASWIIYGKVTLKPGSHTLEIRLPLPQDKKQAMQSFDCFCISRVPFVPAGKFRPDEAIPVNPRAGGIATADWWPFHPVYLADQKPALDFGFLNDPVGKHGYVTMKDGDLFFEDGAPVRFWGTNASYWGGQLIYMDKTDAQRFAEHLSHLGVNCVRIHIMHATNSLIDTTHTDTQHIDPLKLDRLMYLFHALEQKGIYINLDLMYHRMFGEGDGIDAELVRPPPGTPADPKYNVSWACGAAAFWHPRAIELNLALYKQLLTYENPYTHKRLVDSPQMAIVNVQNEQSIFWGTTNVRKGHTREILDQIHTAWLKKKYGTQAALAKAWQIEGKPSPLAKTEDLDSGVVELGPVVMSPNGANDNRVLDQKRFLYDMESGFYQRWIDAMHSWGVRCPIITSNWSGAGNTGRLVLQASTLGGVVDRHNYFNRPESMLTAVGKGTPMTGFEQQAGRAFCISEWNHSTDGSFAYESVPTMATVAAIQGWDALFQFSANEPTFYTGLGSLNTVPPHTILYPVASMIWRRGDIQTGPVVFKRKRDPGYQFGPAKEARVMSTDPAAATGEKTEPSPVPPEILAIGRVQNAYVDKPTPDLYRQDLVSKHWNKDNGVVTSAAGDVEWRYADGWVRLNSPRTQGGFGALGGKKVECDDLTIDSPNTNATILACALEDKPLSQAGRVVVAAVGRAAPNGVSADAGARFMAAPPCLMEPVTGTVSLKTPLKKVYAVSATGYSLGEVAATHDGTRLTFRMDGKPQVVYYLIAAQ